MNKGIYGISKNRTYDTKYHTLVESASYAITASAASSISFPYIDLNGNISAYGLNYFKVTPKETDTGIAANFLANGSPTGYGYAFQFQANTTTNQLLFVGDNTTAAHYIHTDAYSGGAGWPLIFGVADGGQNWNVNSNLLVLTPNQKVGIGTTSPNAKIDVRGGAHFGNGQPTNYINTGDHTVEITATGSSAPLTLIGGSGGVEIWIDTTPTKGVWYGSAIPGVAADGNIHFSTYNTASSWVDRIVVGNTTGNVGIGTSTPTNKLEVIGGVKATSFTGSFSGSIFGYVPNSATSSFVQNTQTSSFVTNLQTSSFARINVGNTFSGDTNTFSSNIGISNTVNATGFTDQNASIYTDGGLRVTKNAYVSGTLYTNDLVVYGTSSLLNITASQLNISTNLITVNTFSPTNRYGGIAVIDSGSSPVGSGSFLYDSLQDEFIFVHKGDGTDVTSSHFLVGPETYNQLGNETYIAANRLLKSQGNEHVTSSNISDTGIIVSINSNAQITGSLIVSNGITGSFSGSVFGYVPNEATTSFVPNTATSSFVPNTATSSFVTNTQTSSFLLNSQTSSMTAGTASKVEGGTANYITRWTDSTTVSTSQIFQNGSNIGIGTLSPVSPVHISSSTSPLMNVECSDAAAYSNIRFTGTGKRYTIGVGNSNETNFGVANDFFVYDDSVGAMRVVVDTNGNMGIGTVTIGTEANLYLGAKNTVEGGQITLQKGTTQASASHLDNYGNTFRILRGTDIENSGANSVDLQLNHTNGQLTLPKYTGSAAFTNTPTALLGVDTSGNITTTGFIDPVKGYQAAGSNIKAFPVGLNTQNFTATAAIATNQQIRFNAVLLSTHETITGVRWYQGALQSGATPTNYNGFGLYSLSGTTLNLIASSSNSTTIWTSTNSTATSWNSIAFDTPPQTLTAGLYYIAHMYSVSAAGTAPTFVVSAAVNNANTGIPGLTTNNKLTCTINTQTTMPLSVAMSTLAASTTFQAVALY